MDFNNFKIIRRKEFGIEPIETPNPNVAYDDRARLMYYLDCVCQLVPDLRSKVEINDLTQYENYRSLEDDAIDRLIVTALLMRPDELGGLVLFLVEKLCGNEENKFYKLTAVDYENPSETPKKTIIGA